MSDLNVIMLHRIEPRTSPVPASHTRARAPFGDRCANVAERLREAARDLRERAAQVIGRGATGRRDTLILRAVELEGMLARVEAMREVDAHMMGMR